MTKFTKNGIFLLSWTIVTALGIFSGFVLVHWSIAFSKYNWTLMLPVSIVLIGIVLGLGQWLVLRLQWPGMWGWIPVTSIGVPLGFILGIMYDNWVYIAWDSLNISCVIGGILGVPQWLLLKRKVAKSTWWIPVSIVSWGFGSLVAFNFVDQIKVAHFTWAQNILLFGVTLGTLYGVSVGIISGIAITVLAAGSAKKVAG